MQYREMLNSNRYSREYAVKYALEYGLKPNPSYKYFKVQGDGGGDCSNFISQCLRAGGAPMDYNGPWSWWYSTSTGKSDEHRWSVTWAVAHSLYWCLKSRHRLGLKGLIAVEVPELNMLELGDIIQYENASEKIYHSAIITSFKERKDIREPLITQHSYDAVNTAFLKPKATKMHFMKIVVI